MTCYLVKLVPVTWQTGLLYQLLQPHSSPRVDEIKIEETRTKMTSQIKSCQGRPMKTRA